MKAADLPFVFDSWMNSWRKCPWAGCIPNNLYFPLQRSAIEQLIGRGATVEIACRTQDENHILGWICSEVSKENEPKAIVHYLYIREAYLPFGIGEALVARCEGAKPGYFTYRYRTVSDACDTRQGWRHIPEISRRK
jgi:hypothetical protein